MKLVVLIWMPMVIGDLKLISKVDDTFINKCLNKIVVNHFETDDLIVADLNEFVINISYPISRYNYLDPDAISFYFRRVNGYVLEVISDEELCVKLEKLASAEMWNSRAKFVIITTFGNTTKIYQTCASYTVYNVALLSIDSAKVLKIGTYFPYYNRDANHPNSMGVETRIVSRCVNGSVENVKNLYPNKLPEEWSNTKLRVNYKKVQPYTIDSNKELYGMEPELVKLIADQLKLTPIFVESNGSDWGYKLSNGTYTNIFRNLQDGKCDMGIGGIHARIDHSKDFEMSFSHMGEDIVWVVPKARRLLAWNKLFSVSIVCWITILLTLIIMSFAFYFITYKVLNGNRSWYSFEVAYRILIGVPVVRVPTNFRVRIIFLSWCMFCLIYKTNFDANFISMLAKDSYEKQISTVQDMIDSKLKFGGFFQSITLYQYSTDKNDRYIYDNMELCLINEDCLYKVAFERNYASIKPKILIEYVMHSRYRTAEGSLLYVLKDKIFRDPLCMYFRKGYPVFPQFNQYLIYAKSSGFVNYWGGIVKHSVELKAHKQFTKSMEKAKHFTDLKQLLTIFVLLLAGLSSAMFVFCLEMLVLKMPLI